MARRDIQEVRTIKMLARSPSWLTSLSEEKRDELVERLLSFLPGANARMANSIMQTLVMLDANDIQRAKVTLAAERFENELHGDEPDAVDFNVDDEGADG